MERYDLAARTRDYISEYVKFGDSKAGAILTLGLTVAGLLAALSDKLIEVASDSAAWVMPVLAVAGILLALATVMLVLNSIEALSPRVSSNRKSLVSFPDIAKEPDWYLNSVASLADGRAAGEIEKHVCELSKIAVEKYTHVTKAIGWLRLQVLGAFALAVLYVVVRAAYPNA